MIGSLKEKIGELNSAAAFTHIVTGWLSLNPNPTYPLYNNTFSSVLLQSTSVFKLTLSYNFQVFTCSYFLQSKSLKAYAPSCPGNPNRDDESCMQVLELVR